MKMHKDLIKQMELFVPYNGQEEKDKAEILRYVSETSDVLTRENRNAHITVSAWVTDKKREYVLMAYHNIYDSWAWLGGHADGNEKLKEVVLREIEEESGLHEVRFLKEDIFSMEILPVFGHEKKGAYVSSHLHLNITYLLEADMNEPIRIKEDENSNIGWIKMEEIKNYSTESWFVERVYDKLCEKVRNIGQIL